VQDCASDLKIQRHVNLKLRWRASAPARKGAWAPGKQLPFIYALVKRRDIGLPFFCDRVLDTRPCCWKKHQDGLFYLRLLYIVKRRRDVDEIWV
jgi:hypothetical protein